MTQPHSPLHNDVNTLRITEIFYSIQGESTYAGQPCVFVRLTGCPLRCTWCDTTYAFHGGTNMSLEAVLEQVNRYACPLVEITGGEPLAQPAASPLITKLCDEGFEVLIETSGSIDIAPVDSRAKIIMDIKCPSSEMENQMRWENLQHITSKDQIKFVISNRQDYDWAVNIVKRNHLTGRCPILFSPTFGGQDLRLMAEWILEDGLQIRFQVQLHKIIWDPETRGV